MAISAAIRRLVRARAGNRCEYCQTSQSELPYATFHVEHIVAMQHGGSDDEENLCLACHWCNFNKGTNLASIDNGNLTALFNPRIQDWNTHFELQGESILGLTAIGRVTVTLLQFNDDERLRLRATSKSHS